jgi:Flp pilus assembly protein TadD
VDLTTTTWTVAHPSRYQQSVARAPDPGTLTTWGDPNVDDPGAIWPMDPETEITFPDVDDEDLTKWLPIPDEVPQDLLEPSPEDLEFAEQEEGPYSEDARLLPQDSAIRADVGHPDAPRGSEAIEASKQVDVAVEQRPDAPFAIVPVAAEAPLEQAPDGDPQGQAVHEATAPIATPSTGSVGVTAPERDEDELREIEAGLAKFKRVVQLNPRNAHAWDALGNLYKSGGQYKEALLAYQQAIANDPSKALYHHHLALVYACEGRMEDAIDALQRVIEIDPDHGLAHAALGGYYRKMGLEDLAQKHVGKAMKSIFDSENEYNRACLAAICGDTDQALRLLRVALQNKQTYVDWILRDPDLDFIRQDPRFKQLISDYAR